MENTRFEYDKLDTDAPHFRLIVLGAGKLDDPIEADLVAQRIPIKKEELRHRLEWRQWEALSHCWGDQSSRQDIMLNDLRFSVSRNIYEALRYLRHEDKLRFVWIDTVCINQDDVREREEQVIYMEHIYRAATQVIIWLGSPSKADKVFYRARALARGLARPSEANYVRWQIEQSTKQRQKELRKEDPVGKPDQDLSKAKEPNSYQISHRMSIARDLVSNHSWFSRLWTIQEAILANQLAVQFGTINMNWEELVHCNTQWDILSGRLETPAFLEGMDRLREDYQRYKEEVFDELELLCNFATQKCSDDRDRIYALMGLWKQTRRVDFPIRYDIDVHEIYTNFAIWYTRSSKNLHILSAASRCTKTGTCALPSWVPDWPNFCPTPKAYARSTRSKESFLACSSYYHAGTFLPMTLNTFSLKGAANEAKFPILALSGVYFGSIKTVGSSSPPESSTTSEVMDCYLNKLMRGITGNPYGSNSNLKSAFWTTLRSEIYSKGTIPTDVEQEADKVFKDWDLSLISNAKLFSTRKGYLGIAPQSDIQAGDIICILFGGHTPFILRESEIWVNMDTENRVLDIPKPLSSSSRIKRCYTVISECYVHGIMDGELKHRSKEKKMQPQDFCLI